MNFYNMRDVENEKERFRRSLKQYNTEDEFIIKLGQCRDILVNGVLKHHNNNKINRK